MKPEIKTNRALKLVFLLTALATGCATTSQEVTAPPKPDFPPDKALVYIYRKPRFGVTGDYLVSVNKQSIGNLPTGVWSSHVTSPGTNIYSIKLIVSGGMYVLAPAAAGIAAAGDKDNEVLKVEFQAGKTYYLRMSYVGTRLDQVDEKT